MLTTKVKEYNYISIWKIPSSNNFVNCHTSYCKQCCLYILKVGNEVNTFFKVGTYSSVGT